MAAGNLTTPRELVRALTAAGAQLAVSGDKLTVTAPRPLEHELIEELRRAKTDILRLLAARPEETERCPPWGEAEEQRAAVVEHDGKVPRTWAEGFARLDPNRRPADVPLRRWQTFIDDVGRFLDGGWAEKAAALGWGPYELFGCDRNRPFARIDQLGLCWRLAGNRVVDLSRSAAVIEMWTTGARQTYRRKPSEPGRVLAWELANDQH
jgi:hypothetical protein